MAVTSTFYSFADFVYVIFYNTLNEGNAWDAWQWRKYMWLAIHDGVNTHGNDKAYLSQRTLQLEHRQLNHS